MKPEASIESLGGWVLQTIAPFIIGFGISIDGPGNVKARSYWWLLVWLWFCIGTGYRLWKIDLPGDWKRVIWCAGVSIAACAMLGGVYYLTNLKTEAIQAQVFEKLALRATLPLNGGDALDSAVSITNGSSELLSWHAVACEVKMIVARNGGNVVRDLGSVLAIPPTSLKAADDEETQKCLDNPLFPRPSACIDMVVDVAYRIAEQPWEQKRKTLRFVREGPDSQWEGQPVDSPHYYCERFVDKVWLKQMNAAMRSMQSGVKPVPSPQYPDTTTRKRHLSATQKTELTKAYQTACSMSLEDREKSGELGLVWEPQPETTGYTQDFADALNRAGCWTGFRGPRKKTGTPLKGVQLIAENWKTPSPVALGIRKAFEVAHIPHSLVSGPEIEGSTVTIMVGVI